MEEYQQATFRCEGVTYGLADEVLAQLMRMAIAEQEEHEKQTGKRTPVPRRRPSFKNKDRSESGG